MTLFKTSTPIAKIHYTQCGAQVTNTVIDILFIIAKSIRNAVSCNEYSFSVLYILLYEYISFFVCAWERLPNVS